MLKPFLDKRHEDRLRAISPRLSFKWTGNKWQIWEKVMDGRNMHVMDIVEEDFKYRPIDERTFINLKKADHAKFRNAFEAYNEMIKRRQANENRKAREQQNAAEAFAKNVKGYVKRQVFATGK